MRKRKDRSSCAAAFGRGDKRVEKLEEDEGVAKKSAAFRSKLYWDARVAVLDPIPAKGARSGLGRV